MSVRICPRVATRDGKVDVSMEEFKKWLKKFDKDGNGRINAKELRDAIHATGGWFCKWKAIRVMKSADENSNGMIDDNEIKNLIAFAKKQFGLNVVAY